MAGMVTGAAVMGKKPIILHAVDLRAAGEQCFADIQKLVYDLIVCLHGVHLP